MIFWKKRFSWCFPTFFDFFVRFFFFFQKQHNLLSGVWIYCSFYGA